MKCNVGKTDRILRVLLGLTIAGIGIYYNSWWGAIGLVFILTSLISWCPIYRIFGATTCEPKDGMVD